MTNHARTLVTCLLLCASVKLVGCASPRTAEAPGEISVAQRPSTPLTGDFLYHYYPESDVYYAPDRALYFWKGAAYWGVGP